MACAVNAAAGDAAVGASVEVGCPSCSSHAIAILFWNRCVRVAPCRLWSGGLSVAAPGDSLSRCDGQMYHMSHSNAARTFHAARMCRCRCMCSAACAACSKICSIACRTALITPCLRCSKGPCCSREMSGCLRLLDRHLLQAVIRNTRCHSAHFLSTLMILLTRPPHTNQ